MAYIGTVGKRIESEVTLIGNYTYTSTYVAWNPVECHIYTMKDSEGNILVWKTSSWMHCKLGEKTNQWGDVEEIFKTVSKGDTIRIKASVKDHSTYKDQEQTVLQRLKVLEIVHHCLTKEEKQELKKKEQLASIQDGDFIWTMPYKQFKEHYSDCETVAGSYNSHSEEEVRCSHFIPATIDVIIRKGRLKNSGVRGQHFSEYQFTNQDGAVIAYKAVNEDNALKRVQKDFPDDTWELTQVFR